MPIPPLSVIIIGLCLLALTACSDSPARASAAGVSNGGTATSNRVSAVATPNLHLAVFDATSLSVIRTGLISIETDLPAEIDVVAYPSNADGEVGEVGLDYITQGAGTKQEQAAAEAHRNVSVTLEGVAGGALIKAWLLKPAPELSGQVKLHVRIPRGASLDIRADQGGNVSVMGEVSNVQAQTTNGTITVRGATGPLHLVTQNGSINVDSFPVNQASAGQLLELHAHNGDITLFAVGAKVMATTIGGTIRFVGSLFGHDNSFSTTGGGQVLMTMPSDLSYHFLVESHGSVVNDFMPETLICAMVHNTDSGLHTNSSPDIMGQITASGTAITHVYTFRSAAGLYSAGNAAQRPYLYFETNRSDITRTFSANDSLPNGGNPAQGWWPPECDAINQQQAQLPAVKARISAETGTVTMRLIRKH